MGTSFKDEVVMSRFFSNIAGWFAAESTPRWWLIAGALGLFALQNGIDEIKDRQTQSDIRIQSYQHSSWALEAYLGSYVDAVVAEREDLPQIKDSLRTEIIKQYEQLGVDRNLLTGNASVAAEDYQNALFDLSGILSNSFTIETMGPFWTSAARVIDARNEFFKVLG
jgi:hypothetical protein